MNRKKRIIFFILIATVGLIVLLYPVGSKWINSLGQARVINEYNSELEKQSENELLKRWKEAKKYNKKIFKRGNCGELSRDGMKEYMRLIDITGNGIMGTLEISKINVRLPIFHGTGDSSLQIGAGHFEGTSLPVGGKNTHAVITGHRGLPSAMMLTELDGMEKGDTFVLRILKKTLTYEVDQISIVLPDDISLLEIEEGKDYCTLVTCTPYGINSHRILVRGYRIPNIENPTEGFNAILSDMKVAVIMTAIIILPLIIMFVYLIKKHKKIRKKVKDDD